jgi:uncharacterized protein (DUF2141 family)
MYKNKMLIIIFLLGFYSNVYAEVPFFIEIRNVTINGGTIILGYYTSQEAFSNQRPDWHTTIEPINETIIYEIHLPQGEYMIGIHQDTNGNGVMDYGLFGIPKEPYAFSNMRGKRPGSFNQMKFRISNQNERIIIPLVRF